jgi:hypothetical protein
MSLNTSHSPTGQGVLIYNGELILVYAKEVHLNFDANDPVFKGTKKGALYLTTHRIIFVNKDGKDRFMSFCMPFHCIRDVKLEQPVFGANYLKGIVLAQPGGNWTGDAVFKLTFNQGGCIEFGEALLNAVSLAGRYQAYVSPPPYAPPACGMFSAPPAYYMAQGGQCYGLNVPNQAFPDAPPIGSVYMFESPPPYTGIGPVPTCPNVGATGEMNGNAYNKEMEARQSHQQNQFQQEQPPAGKPPAYDDLFGKR